MSKSRFLDIKKIRLIFGYEKNNFLCKKNQPYFWYQEFDFLLPTNRFLAIKNVFNIKNSISFIKNSIFLIKKLIFRYKEIWFDIKKYFWNI